MSFITKIINFITCKVEVELDPGGVAHKQTFGHIRENNNNQRNNRRRELLEYDNDPIDCLDRSRRKLLLEGVERIDRLNSIKTLEEDVFRHSYGDRYDDENYLLGKHMTLLEDE